MALNLTRNLVFFDLETTGLNPLTDRIIEFCFIKLKTDNTREYFTKRIKPLIPISNDASKITNIYQEDLINEPTFNEVALDVYNFIKDADFAGFNVLKFDLPCLIEELKRCNINLDINQHKIIDVQRIYHKKEPRNLSASLQFYCNKELTNAHSAEADVEATIDVLLGQLDKYNDLENNVSSLAKFCLDERWVDRTGRLHWVDNKACFAFGKHKGKTIEEIIKTEISFIHWILKNDFPQDTKDILEKALGGTFPTK